MQIDINQEEISIRGEVSVRLSTGQNSEAIICQVSDFGISDIFKYMSEPISRFDSMDTTGSKERVHHAIRCAASRDPANK